MYDTPNPLPIPATLYRQPRKTSDVKTVLPTGTAFVECLHVPDFPGWWSVILIHHTTKKRGYIYVPTPHWHDGDGRAR